MIINVYDNMYFFEETINGIIETIFLREKKVFYEMIKKSIS